MTIVSFGSSSTAATGLDGSCTEFFNDLMMFWLDLNELVFKNRISYCKALRVCCT